MVRKTENVRVVTLQSAWMPIVEHLELRRLLSADLIQTLPFRLDFNTSVANSLLDKDGQGIGLTRVQANAFGTEYQPSLLDVDPAAGVLRITTTGNSNQGSNSNADNSQVNALETQFNGTTSGFAINARLIGPLGYLNETNEQAGIYFGPDSDNYIKLAPAFTSTGQVLQFVMETKSSNGTITQAGAGSNDRLNIGSFANINTLDLRIVGDASTGKVTAFYAINGGAFQKMSLEHTVPSFNRPAFFNAASRAGVIAYHKHNNQPITATYDYFEITPGQAVAARPSVAASSPTNGATNIARNSFVALDLNLPNVGHGVDASTLTSTNVRLVRTSDNSVVPANINTTAGGDAIVLQPSVLLAANTTYSFQLTDAVRDTSGAAFLPFSITFTTGTQGGTISPNIAFEKVPQNAATGHAFTSVTMGPDGRLYATTNDGKIIRYNVGADGALSGATTINTITTREAGPRLVTGLVFHPNSTANNLVAYVSHGEYAFENATDWTGKVTKLSGSSLQTGADLVTGLPRSIRDHLNNQMVFGPDGALYLSQASNSAMGAPDSAWGNRPERLLSAAILRIDLNNIPSTVNVRTEGISNPYNPFAAGAPVTIYASGVRNAYDLLWHSNGFLYAPTNGSAANGNAPASPNPAISSNRIDQSIFGTYTGPVVPGITKVTATQNDFLYKIEPLGYYGHPNPTRFEWVLNGGNPTSGVDLAEVAQYPVGTQPDRNFRGFAYDFGRNYSPNGVIEFKGNAFGGALDGKILVVRYSGGDDIIVLEPGANGNVVASQTGILGFSGFVDPLDLIQDPGTGFLYVAEYGGERITLLRPTSTTGGQIAVDKSNYYFNDVTTAAGHSAASPAQSVVIRNTGAGTLTISQLTLTGANPSEFTLVNAPTLPLAIAPGQSATIQVAMRATTVGLRSATLRITSSAGNASTLDLSLRGLGTTGTGGDFEPSLQRILDLYQIPINVGDTDPSTTAHFTSGGPATPNDEVLVQRLQKAGSGPVTVELLANFANTVSPSTKFGWYEAGLTHKKTQLFTVSESDSQSVNPTANGTTTFDPGSQPFGIYGVFPAFTQREVFSEDSLNQWETNSALRRKVRFYPLKNADGSVVPNAYVFAFEEFNQAFDTNDIVGVIRNVRIADAAPHISFENRTGLPFPDRMVMNRIRELDPNYPNEVWDTNTLRIRNTGNQPLTITSMVINTSNFIFDGYTGGAITIQPNGFYDVKVKFVFNQTGNGVSVRTGTLTVNSNDNETPSRQVELAGIWQSHSEMTPAGIPIEPTATQIINALGYKVNILNTGQNINTGGNVTKVGEEVLSPYWMKAEGGNVTVRLLAAYHQQKPTSASSIRWHVSTSNTLTNLFTHRPQQGQSLFPYIQNSTTNPAQASFNPGTNAFGFRVDGTWSDPARNVPNSANDNGHGMRWYIAKDRDGNIIPNTYILCHDYSGVSYSNYDYQDNIYIVTNVRPVNGPTAVVGASASSSGSGIALSWTRNTEGNVAGYRILRSSSANGTFSVVADLVTGNTFTDGTAPVGQTSFYRIVAVDVHGTASSGFGTASATRQSDTTPPGVPTGLTASGTASGILLDWANNSEADLAGYNVYRSNALNGTYTKINASLLTVSELLDATAPSNATSFYRVSAVDTSGNESGFASISAFRPSAGDIPTAPTSLTAIANSQTQITISWTDNSNNETGFRIERRIGNGSFTLLTTVGSNVTNFVDASVGAGTSYTYRVRALGAAGDSAFSNEATASTPQGIPAAPSNLVGNANSASLVTLMWSDNSGNETGFAIERRIGSGAWVRIFTTIANATSYNDTSVTALTSYSYRVIALNDAGESPASNEVAVNTPAVDDFTSVDIGNPTPPGSTTVVTAGRDYNVSVGGTDIWGNADSFRFVYKQVTGDFDVKMRVQSVLEVDASMAGLMARADLTAGSANIYVKARPTGFRTTFRTTAGGASNGAGGGDFSYPNAWVRLRRVGNTYTAFVSTDGTNWTQHTQQNLNLGSTVFLGMAVSARTQSAATVAQLRDFGDTFGAGAPTAPSNLQASPQSDRILLSWSDNSDNETGFRVERRVGSGAWSTLITTPANITTHTDTTAIAGTVYGYRVIALGASGDSAPSNEVTAQVPTQSSWTSVDIGNPTPGSTTELSPKDIDLAAGGTDIWGTADSFRFAYKQVSGDFDVVVRVSEMLVADSGSTGGIMVRETTAAGSRHAFMRIRSDSFRFNWRENTNGTSAGATGASNPLPNAWLRLRRVGNTMTGFQSTDGTNWTQVGQVNIAMGSNVLLGLAGTARKSSGLATIRFRDFGDFGTPSTPQQPPTAPNALAANVQGSAINLVWADNASDETGFQVERQVQNGSWALLTTLGSNVTTFTDNTVAPGTTYIYRVRAINAAGPSDYSNTASATTPAASAFTSADIGNPTPGSTTEIVPGRDFNLTAGGTDIWANADSFRYVYTNASGDFDVVVRIANMNAVDGGSTGGIMVRESLSAGSRHAFVRIRTDSFRFNWRDVTDGRSFGVSGASNPLPNAWLRLQRVGNTLIGYQSTNGTTWSIIGQISINLGSNVLLGLAGTARSTSGLATFQFRDYGDFAAPRPADAFALSGQVVEGVAQLAWTNTPIASSVLRLERATAGGAWTTIANLAPSTTSFADSTIASGTSYVYRLISTDAEGIETTSNTLELLA